MTNERSWDAVVIGGGIAGLSAAQMLGRARRRTLVIDGGSPRNRFAAHMHGVLGHDGVDPAELLRRGREEVAAYGVVVVDGSVTTVIDDGDRMRIIRDDGTIDHARAVVIASGIRDVLPEVEGLAALWGRSVLHCPYCHGWEVAERRLGVLATSPTSIHQIELVRQWSDDVTAFTADAGHLDSETMARLIARGIRVVTAPARALVTGDSGALTAVRDVNGTEHPLDALFVAPTPAPDLAFVDGLHLTRADGPGSPLAVDALGSTSHPRVWAAGNTTAPYGNVPLSMGAGSMAGAAVNAALVAEDARHAVESRRHQRNAHWEERYASDERFWSGRVNATFAAVAQTLSPGSALDIGCGEGADAVWLAERGWQVTAVDVSETAVARGLAAAEERGLTDRVRFIAADAGHALPEAKFDLVASSFLHSWEPDFPRIPLLRTAAERVAPGGHLLVLSHAAPPPWARKNHDDDTSAHDGPPLLGPREELDLLRLDASEWTTILAEVRPRAATAPTGESVTIDDGVLLLQRAAR
ncbi:FAD-dependent oxidoreductase [Microbacterium sp.]|uniref:FAD-dependent oxidoreductase n=1 Tax=Microbacterium sp. TaxID=51671 RepID=UPI0039E687BE